MIIFGYDLDVDLEKYEDKFELIRQYQKFVYILIVVIVVIYSYLSFITPKFDQIKESKETLKRYQQVLDKKKAELKEKEHIERVLNELVVQLKQREENFFSEEMYKDFVLDKLHSIAEENKVNIESLDIGKETLKDRNIFSVPIGLKFECEYAALMNFIKSIEMYPQIVEASSISITRRSLNPVRLLVSINLQAYMIKNDKAN